MSEINETPLPGVGIRYDFKTSAGARVGVVHSRTGRRELLVYDRDDPDTCREVVRLDSDDARSLIEILGGTQVTEHLGHMAQAVEGLAIDWLPMNESSPYDGKTIGDTRARTRTGVSVVAVLRGDEAVPAPGPEFGLRSGDTLVVVGTPRGIEALAVILRTG